MTDDGYWSWRTRLDEIVIAPTVRGRFDLMLNGYKVGNYHSAESALSDAVQGSHFSIPSGLRTSDLSPSGALRDWTFVPLRSA